MSTGHTIKDIYTLSEGRLDLVHKEVNVRTKPICKNFCNNFEDDTEETSMPELIDYKSIFFIRNESNKSIVETLEVHDAIVELGEQGEYPA